MQIFERTMKTTYSADGTCIAFWKTGSGPPLLLVHGGVCDHLAWYFVTPLLAQRFTVYSFDRRGRGSSGDTPPYAVEREVEDILAMLSTIGEPAHLLGHSAGGILALAVAERRSDLLSLMLYEPAFIVDGARERPGPEVLERIQSLLAAGDRDEVLRIAMRETVAIPESEIKAMRSTPGWEHLRNVAHTIPYDWMVWERQLVPQNLIGLHMPVLLLIGSHSPSWLHAGSRAIHADLPHAQVIELQGQGHSAMVSDPGLFAREIQRFVDECGTASENIPAES